MKLISHFSLYLLYNSRVIFPSVIISPNYSKTTWTYKVEILYEKFKVLHNLAQSCYNLICNIFSYIPSSPATLFHKNALYLYAILYFLLFSPKRNYFTSIFAYLNLNQPWMLFKCLFLPWFSCNKVNHFILYISFTFCNTTVKTRQDRRIV